MTQQETLIIAMRNLGDDYARAMGFDYREASLLVADCGILMLACDPQSREAVEMYAEFPVLRQKLGLNTSTSVEDRAKLIRQTRFYALEVAHRNLGGTWTVKSGWFS